MTEKRRTCVRLLLKLLHRIYETRFRNDKLLGWTRNVGGILFATRRYDIVTKLNWTTTRVTWGCNGHLSTAYKPVRSTTSVKRKL